MLRRAVVTRAAWLPSPLRLAAAVGRRAGKRRTSSRSSKTMPRTTHRTNSAGATRHRKKVKSSSAGRRSVGVLGTASSAAATLHAENMKRTTNANAAVTTASATSNARSSSSSSGSSHAAPHYHDARPDPDSCCRRPADVTGWNASVEVVQRRIRSRLAQLVLLSPIPLQPSRLFTVYRRTLDADTAGMLAWASYAVHLTETAARRAGHDAGAGAGAAEGPHSDVGSSGFSSAAWATLQRQGESFARAFRASVVPLMDALRAGDAVLPAVHEVERWLVLSVLFTDPEFRVTFHGGYVCYPVAPALLLATVDPVRDHEVRQLCFAAQWRTKGTTAQRRAFVASALASATTSATAAAATAAAVEQAPTLEAPPDAVDAKAEGVTAPSYARTAWLNGAAGAPTWTTAHAILLAFELPKWRMSAPASSSSTSSGPGGSGLAVDTALRRAVAAVLAGTETSGHLLVDAMLPALSANGFRDDPHADAAAVASAGAVASAEVGAERPRAAAAAAQPATQGWNEGKRSRNPAMRVVDEMGEGGPVAAEMTLLSSPSLATTPLHNLNRRLLPTLFRRLSDMPISVARLSTMLRWNLSAANAADFHSLVYFLLVLGANPLLRRMKESHQSLRRVNEVVADVWGTGGAAATAGATAPERSADDDDTVKNAVRQELLEHDSSAFASLKQAPAGGAAAAAARKLRQALGADANVVAALTTAQRPVEELLCARVLPWARPGSAATPAVSSPSPTSSSFFGFALHHIEVLPTWQLSPEEVVHYLRTQHETAAQPLGATWLETCEEPHLLVWCVSHSWVDLRLRRAAELYLHVVLNQRRKRRGGDGLPPLILSIRKLALLLLWTHEYGAAMAAELLFVSLLTCRERVLLHPPKAATSPSPASPRAYASASTRAPPAPSTDYGAWKVEFIQ